MQIAHAMEGTRQFLQFCELDSPDTKQILFACLDFATACHI